MCWQGSSPFPNCLGLVGITCFTAARARTGNTPCGALSAPGDQMEGDFSILQRVSGRPGQVIDSDEMDHYREVSALTRVEARNREHGTCMGLLVKF